MDKPSEDKHSHIGASSAYRWMNCPGSVRLCAGQEKRSPSDYALVGTAAHEVCEKCLLTGADPSEYVGQKVEAEGVEIEITEEIAEGVRVYVDRVRDDLKKFGGQLAVEQKFDLSWLYPGMFGRNDAAILPTGLFEDLRIYDYKNGRKAVTAENNVQCMYYALGALGRDNVHMAERVFVHIIQPNSFGKDAVEMWETRADELYQWAQEVLLPAAQRTEDPEAPCVPGSWCFFCEAQGVCPAKRKEVLDLFDEVGLPSIQAREVTLPDPEELPAEVIGKLMAFFTSDGFEAWLKALGQAELDALERGVAIPGRRLIEYEYKGNRKWNDPEQAERILLPYGKEVLTLKTPAQVEKVLTSQKVQKAFRESLLGELTIREISQKKKVVSDGAAEIEFNRKSALDLFDVQ